MSLEAFILKMEQNLKEQQEEEARLETERINATVESILTQGKPVETSAQPSAAAQPEFSEPSDSSVVR